MAAGASPWGVGWSSRWRWAALVIALLATVVWLLPAVVTDATVGRAGPFAAGHIPVQGEDYFSVVNGRTPLVNYIAQYANLLPLLLAAVRGLRHLDPPPSRSRCARSRRSACSRSSASSARSRAAPGSPSASTSVRRSASSLERHGRIAIQRDYYGVFPGRASARSCSALALRPVLRGRRIPIWALFGFAGLVVLNNSEFGVGALIALIVPWASVGTAPLRSVARLGDLVLQGTAGLMGAPVLVCAIR